MADQNITVELGMQVHIGLFSVLSPAIHIRAGEKCASINQAVAVVCIGFSSKLGIPALVSTAFEPLEQESGAAR